MVTLLTANPRPKAVRDLACVRLLYDLALRCSEVVSLDLADLDLDQSRLAVKGKGQTSKQFLTLPPGTKQALAGWVSLRGIHPGPLFTSFDPAGGGNRLTSLGLYLTIKRLGEKVGVRARPHGLRHTSITEACKLAQANGYGLEEVLDFSRHNRNSLAILMVYRDRERNVQGQIASLVGAAVRAE
jgi:integrase/recombinase XerC